MWDISMGYRYRGVMGSNKAGRRQRNVVSVKDFNDSCLMQVIIL